MTCNCMILSIVVFLEVASPICVTLLADHPASRDFDVCDHGARGDGQAIDTAAIQTAIDACSAAGGGRVLFPAGRYLTGTLHLRDRVELHLAEGAAVVGVKELDAYAGFESGTWGKTRWNRGLIVGEGIRDVTISGAGVVDGNQVFDPQGEEKMRGPHTILLANCQGVTLRDVTIHDSGNYAFLFYGTENVLVQNVTFEGGWDGVHFRGKPDCWNRDIRITGCKFFTGDDCIAGHYIEDALVEDCTINSSCNGVRLIGPARRMTLERCDFFGPGKFEHRTSRDLHRTNMLAAIIIQPSAWTPTPGPLEDLCIRDVTMNRVACALHVSIRKDNSGDRFTCERLKATGVYGPAISVESWADAPFGTVTLRDIDVQFSPDAEVDPRLSGKPTVQSPIRPPGADVFARKLPVWGCYGRNLKSLDLSRARFVTTDPGDACCVVRGDNVDKLIVKHMQYSPSPAGTEAIECNDVGVLERDDAGEGPMPPQMKKNVANR